MSYILLKDFIGKDRGLKFCQGAHVEIVLKIGDSKNEAFAGYAIIWGGLLSCCYRKSEEPDFTFEQVCDAVDKLSVSQIHEIAKCYSSTLPIIPDTEKKNKPVNKQQRKNIKSNASK